MKLNVRKYRIMALITQKNLAKEVGISQSYLSKLELNEHEADPKISLVSKMAKVLDVCPFGTILLCDCHDEKKEG